MELKLFAAKRQEQFAEGLMIVAAESIENAYETYLQYVKDTNNIDMLYLEGRYNDFPLRNWYEIEDIEVECVSPRVIDFVVYSE